MHRIKIKNQNVLLLSDTHGKHRLVDIPENIQIVIHCGDVCNAGNRGELIDFFEWYAGLEIPYKVFVNGNHDLPFELEPERSKELIPKEIIWLNDEAVEIDEIGIMGISSFPFYNHFETKTKMDIIASHYPPYGILDSGFGSEEIRDFIFQLAPEYHVFGHNHSGYGRMKERGIRYINASVYHQLRKKER